MPPMKKDGESDADDMSGAESENSVCSRPLERESSDEAETEADDSSEMSEGEIDRIRAECIENLNNLERQFSQLREQLYRERLSEVDTEITEVRVGRSDDYLKPLERFNEEMNTRKEIADNLKRFRLENINHKYDSEKKSALEHFESEKQLAMDCLKEELLDKIRRLEEDRHNVDISWADWGTGIRINKVRGPGRKKAVTVSGPYIVYMLRDEDILEDWTAIRKAVKRSTSTTAS